MKKLCWAEGSISMANLNCSKPCQPFEVKIYLLSKLVRNPEKPLGVLYDICRRGWLAVVVVVVVVVVFLVLNFPLLRHLVLNFNQ
jgi:hypothetical protein